MSTSLHNRFATMLVRDATGDGVPARWAWAVFWFPLVGGLAFVALYLVSRSAYYWLLREDHLVEWTQFAVLLFALPLAVAGAVRTWRRGDWLTATFLVLVAIGLLLLAGEEVSWGQRILGVSGHFGGNRQGELNLHNISSARGIPVEQLFRAAEAAIGLVGAVLPFLVRRVHPLLRARLWRVITPPVWLAPCFALVFVFRLGRLVLPVGLAAVISFQEWAELCLYVALAVWVTLMYLSAGPRWNRTDETPRRVLPDLGRGVPVAAGVAVVVTGVCVVLTLASGIEPGNVKSSGRPPPPSAQLLLEA